MSVQLVQGFKQETEKETEQSSQFKGAEQSRGGLRTYLRLRASALGAGAPPEGDDRRGGYWAVGAGRRGGPSRLQCGEEDGLGGDRGGVEEDEVGADWRAGRSVGAGGSCFPAERSVAWQRNSVARGFGTPTRRQPFLRARSPAAA